MSADMTGLPPPAPKELICPITQELMVDPVFAEDGFSYERIAMERWFSTGKRRSPVTNEILTDRSTQLTPNKVIKTMIQNYKRETGAKLLAACKIPNQSSSGIAAEEGLSDNSVPISSLALAAYIDAGADINLRDEDGNTPLMLLLQTGRIYLAREILEYGARASQRNDLGTSPINLCEKLRDEGHGVEDIEDGSALGAWNDMISQLEELCAKEVIADEIKERAREASSAAARERASEMERQENRVPAAAEALSVGDALRRAHIGPGLGFFPSLFALQFQNGMPHPLTRPDLENAGPGEVKKLKIVDKALKAITILVFAYLIFVL